MEDTPQKKEKSEDIQTELHDTNGVLRRPKNFSLHRRSDAYYFSDNSPKGILKRVPIKNGSYKMNELETVPDAEKNRNEIWSDVPLNNLGSSKADQNGTAARNEDSYEAIEEDSYEEKENETVSKLSEEIAEFKLQTRGLKNLALIKEYKTHLKTKNNGEEQLSIINEGQKEERCYKSLQGPKSKKYETNVSIPPHYEKLKRSDEKYENLSASNTRSSSKKSDEPEDVDELNLIQLKTPITEL